MSYEHPPYYASARLAIPFAYDTSCPKLNKVSSHPSVCAASRGRTRLPVWSDPCAGWDLFILP